MSYAIDLTPRQSARTIEQAIRQQAELILEPRAWNEPEHLFCRLEPPGNPLDLDLVPVLTLAVLSRGEPSDDVHGIDHAERHPVPIDQLRELAGTYVDAALMLGPNRYLFSTDLIRALPASMPDGPPRVHISRPAILQVSQRRRFRRIHLSHSAQVELTWTRPDEGSMGGVGWLCNVSGEGLACRTEQRIADTMWIGDELDIEFTLAPGDTERFRLQGVLCNKTPTGSMQKVILGIQFYTDEAHPASAQATRVLRQRLIERAAVLADTRKGVDH